MWFHDNFAPGEVHLHSYSKLYFSIETEYQKVELVESPVFGKLLLIDGDVQSSLRDEHIYHETLVHPAMLLSDNCSNVFLAGGGEGATLREIVKYKKLEKVVKCDIDKIAIEAYIKELTEWHQGSFFDKRVELKHMDARGLLETYPDKFFDVIITDLTEPTSGGPSQKLFSKEFFTICRNKLKDSGILALQASLLRITTYEMHSSIIKTLNEVFPLVFSGTSYVPSFDTTWGFAYASRNINISKFTCDNIDKLIEDKIEGKLKFFDGISFLNIFSLGKDLRELIKNNGNIITDDEPFYLKRKDEI